MLDWEMLDEEGEFDSVLKIVAEGVDIRLHLDLSDERGLRDHLIFRAKERGEHLTI